MLPPKHNTKNRLARGALKTQNAFAAIEERLPAGSKAEIARTGRAAI
jgi:hypothetical protein